MTRFLFEYREGIAPLPRQLALGEIDQSVKAELWHVINEVIELGQRTRHMSQNIVSEKLQKIYTRHHVQILEGFSDEIKCTVPEVKNAWKVYFQKECPYGQTLGFVEWFLDEYQSSPLNKLVAAVLERTRCAYRVVDSRIMPVASKEEGEALINAIATLETASQAGARKHLLDAGSHLSSGRFADSVRESIHAIEGLLRNVTGEKDFSKAVAIVSAERDIHSALKRALTSLYGYSSDEQGIRHPLLDKGDANVSERDALFMLGVCASFATYLSSASAAS